MRVCVLADLQCSSVATTSTCTTKLERFDKIRTRGISNFKNKFLEMAFQLLGEIIIYLRNWSVELLEKLQYVLIYFCRLLLLDVQLCLPRPVLYCIHSIRLALSSQHTEQDLAGAASVIKEAANKILS